MSEFIVCTVQVGVGLHVHMYKPNWVIMKSYFYILADPVLLEMTVQYLQEKIQDMESVQKTILLRLENIEQLVRGRDTEKQTGHAHAHMKIPGITLTMALMTVNIGNPMLTIHLSVPLHLTLKVPNLSMSLCLQTLRPNLHVPFLVRTLSFSMPLPL